MRDLDTVFAGLDRSAFRRRFRLGSADGGYLHSRGLQTVLAHAGEFVAQRLAPAAPLNDGRQTPMRGHPAFVAQHATGTCCRACLAKWYGIPVGRPLRAKEQEHVVRAIGRWLAATDAAATTAPVSRRTKRPTATARRPWGSYAASGVQPDLFGSQESADREVS